MPKRNGRKKLALQSTALIPQAHGGALRNGNPKGSPGGPGVLSNVVRQIVLGKFRDVGIPALVDAARQRENLDVSIKAADILGKHGFGSDAASIAAAQMETPDGMKFTLILGERGRPDD